MRSLTASAARLFSGLRFRLLVLVLLACAPLITLILHTADQDRRRAIANWNQKLHELQQTASRDEEELIGGTRQLLLAISESSYVRSFNRTRCEKGLTELFASYPRFANLGVLTTNGMVLASARPMAEGILPDHEFMQTALGSSTFTVGAFPSSNRRASILFGHPVLDRNSK